MARKLRRLLAGSTVNERYGNRLEVITDGPHAVSALVILKSSGFEHLSNITCVDWIDEHRMDVTYNLWSYTHRLHAVVKAQAHRDALEVPTTGEIWPQAQVYEREIHEMFGVEFTGNPDLSPLFLHNWRDMPPLRKDFDTEEYSRRAYGVVDGVEEAGV